MLGRKAAAPDEQYSLMLNNLAGVNVSLGYHERARGLLKTSLEQWKKLDLPGGRQQAGLAATSYNLGKLYQKMGRPDEALPWMQKALDACHRAFGPEHPKTLKINEAIAQLEN
jgi:tetratricopeptide (TPR) repeat protein